MGATLKILENNGLNSARNTLTYSDAGGITIKDQDKFGRYTVFYNTFLAGWRRSVVEFKRSANVEGAYGGVASDYADNWY